MSLEWLLGRVCGQPALLVLFQLVLKWGVWKQLLGAAAVQGQAEEAAAALGAALLGTEQPGLAVSACILQCPVLNTLGAEQ